MNKKALYAGSAASALLATVFLWPQASPAPASIAKIPAKPQASAATVQASVEPLTVDLAMAFEQKKILAEFIGNGRDRMKIMLMNKSDGPIHLTIPVGQMFEGDHSTVVNVHPGQIDIAPGKTEELMLHTVAARSSNALADSPFALSYGSLPRIEPLLAFVQDRPEIPLASIQTAALALIENLPLSAVAKFTLASTPLPSRFNTDAFRTDTFEIVTALATLRELKIKEENLTMTIDPQLKIEAMIDPNARPVAMRYYAIDPEREWDFWRNELLNGEPATRHYALYGIARFYPDVALEMLPRWARETRTNPVYRLSAVQALADTQRPEALATLRLLGNELGHGTELAKAATGAADYLEYRLAQINSARSVAFRTTSRRQEAGALLR